MSDVPPHRHGKKRRGGAGDAAPFVSLKPWAGFTAHDMKRTEPLRCCPNARCRRAKACIAALDNLYCQRTHHPLAEQRRRHAQSPLRRELDNVPEVDDGADLAARVERIAALAQIRRAHDADMLGQWKAGALSHLYGPYRPSGVVLNPPSRFYVEMTGDPPKTEVDNAAERTYRPRRRPRFRGAERP